MEEFNYDPTLDLENKWHLVEGKDTKCTCNDNKSVTFESYKKCKMLDAILNRCLASSTHKLKKPIKPLVYAWKCTCKGKKPNAKTT